MSDFWEGFVVGVLAVFVFFGALIAWASLTEPEDINHEQEW